MKKVTGRIIVIVVLVVFFIVIYSAVGAAFGNSEVKFGYWVNMDTKDEYRNFIILGTDKDETRTDLILLCQYSKNNNTLSVMQIPRDTKVETTRSDKKINSAYGSKKGIDAVKSEIESLTGIYPDNYVVLNFKAFRGLVDAIGGIEYNVPMRMYYTDPAQNLTIDLKAGYQTLSGEKAEMFMRFRQNNDGSGYADGDIGRLKAQKNFYDAAMKKLLSLKAISNLDEVVRTVGSNVKTDFTISDLMNHIDDLKRISDCTVNIVMLPGNSGYMKENGNAVSYYVCDEEKTRELTNKYFKLRK